MKKVLTTLTLLTILYIFIPLRVGALTVAQTNAIKEVAYAYIKQGTQIQYDSYRKQYNATPADATSKHTVYTVCSGFTYIVYKQALGIELPETTEELFDFAKYLDKNNKSNMLLAYYDDVDEIYSADVLGDCKPSGERDENKNVIYKCPNLYKDWKSKLQTGDLLIVSGHVMLVEKLSNGELKILEASEGSKYNLKQHIEVYEDESKTSSQTLLDFYGGTLSTRDFQNKLYTYTYKETKYKNCLKENGNDKSKCDDERITELAIIRPSGGWTTKYLHYNKSGSTETTESRDFAVTSEGKARVNFPNIDVAKTIYSKKDQSFAYFGDTLVYKIKIYNKSNKAYTNIEVEEVIDSRLTVTDKAGGTLSGNKLKWVIESIPADGEVEIKYKVKIPKKKELLGEIFVSTGRVGNSSNGYVSNSRIETVVRARLTSTEIEKLRETFQEIKNDSTYKNNYIFINNLYKESLGIDLGMSSSGFDLDDVFKYNSTINAGGSSTLQVQRTELLDFKFNKYILQNFYGPRLFGGMNPNSNNGSRDCGSSNLVRAVNHWNNYAEFELNDRVKTITPAMLVDGDVILLKTIRSNGDNKNKDTSYVMNYSDTGTCPIEDLSTRAYIYLDETLYIKRSGELVEIKGDKLETFLRDIIGENFVLLRPVVKKSIGIELDELPVQITYIQGSENLDLTGGKIKVFNNDTTTSTVKLDNSKVTVSGFDNSKIGIQTLTVSYNGYKTTFNVEVISKQITGISMKKLPNQTSYIQNYEVLSKTGGSISVAYNDNSTSTVSLSNSNVTISGFDNSKIGTKKLTVSYNGYTTTFNVQIVSKQINEISMKQRPTQTSYIQNYENLVLTGGEIKVKYNDNSTSTVSLTNSKVTVSGFDNTKLGTQPLSVSYNGYKTTFDVEVVLKQITGISIYKIPTQTKFTQNYESLDLTGGIIMVAYDDNSTSTVSLSNSKVIVSGFDNTKLGTQSLTVSYNGYQTTFDVEIISKEITGISRNTPLIKTTYIQNYESLDLTGGTIRVTYNDETNSIISLSNSKVAVSGFDNTEVGNKEITVEYQGYTTPFEVEIISKQITEISLNTMPVQTIYIQNHEDLDLTGGTIKVTYNDETTSVVNLTNSNVKHYGFDNTKLGKNEVTVEYQGKTVAFDVEIISKQVIDVAMNKRPTQTTYIQNYEELDLTGGVIAVTYDDGSTSKVSLTNSNVTVSDFDNSVVGVQTLTVSYNGYQTTFEVEIISKQIVKVELTTLPKKLKYTKDEKLDLTGGIITVTYTDGTKDEISLTSSNVKVYGFDIVKEGTNNLTIEYLDTTFTFEVEVDYSGSIENPQTGMFVYGVLFLMFILFVLIYLKNKNRSPFLKYN